MKFLNLRNMPFCVMPISVADSILSKRVVINEHFVLEFNVSSDLVASSSSSRLSTLSKRASTLMATSPRSTKLPEKVSMMNQQPILSNSSPTNPFYDNQFPVSYNFKEKFHKFFVYK